MAEIFKQIAKGSNPITKASQWAVIKQAFPGVTFLNPGGIQAFSNSQGNYEGATNSIKTLISFPTGFQLARILVPWYSGAFGSLTTTSNSRAVYQANYSGSVNGAVTATLRIRPITAPYDLTSVTWNSFIATPPSMTSGMTINVGTVVDALTLSKGGSADLPSIAVTTVTPSVTYYGFVIDIKLTAPTTNLTSSSISLSEENNPGFGVPIPFFTDGSGSAPYLLKI